MPLLVLLVFVKLSISLVDCRPPIVDFSAVHFYAVHVLRGALFLTGQRCPKSRTAILHYFFLKGELRIEDSADNVKYLIKMCCHSY